MLTLPPQPAVTAALISAIVTISIFIIKGITGSFWDKYFHKYKIKIDHEYEQRKKIKEAISKYKVPLLSSAEDLNHRLWNFSTHCHKGWHILGPNESVGEKYYLQSFCYRLLAFLAWCKKFERESIYLDSTLSAKNDLTFVKYIKTMQNTFSNAFIFNGLNYDSEHATDHFFKDELAILVEHMITPEGVITFTDFKKIDKEHYQKMTLYISSILTSRNCNKWYLMNGFHFILMAFLSKYGYDYQKTELQKLKGLRKSQPQNIIAENLNVIVKQGKLDGCKEMKKAINVLLSI
ncbi:hypothetical protein NFJ22_06940 [Citrobacter braakii]|uniref:hypothetical protein n=1 Tax=Citrobacter braakii TaxID=57706 RepID=UPI00242D8AA0|nr:hypothetical protein [Citrobacter braakii]WFV19471.1 hypothetical protein NFJ22_06940 [Citrobacter braakii]